MRARTIAIFLWLAPYFTIATTPAPATGEKLVCEPFGLCEPCPETTLHEPFCRPFGNRRLLHCRPEGSSKSEGERPMFGPCGRVVAQARADFFEFVACNLAVFGLGLVVWFVRSRRLEDVRARTLAARIGFSRVPRN